MQLADHDVHLWRVDVEQVTPDLLNEYRQLMSPDEMARNQRYRFERDRKRDCVTRGLARLMISQYVDIPAAELAFEKGEHDKPELVNSPVPLRFNLSHTSRYVVCAATPRWDIGVDIEHIERKNDVLSIADHYFSALETKALFQLPKKELQLDRFFDYWTLKESYMKAHGEGLSLGLGNFSFDLMASGEIGISFSEKLDDNPDDWLFRLYRPTSDHRMALALRSGGDEIKPHIQLFETIPSLAGLTAL